VSALRIRFQVSHWLSDDIGLWLLVDDEALRFLQSVERFLLDAVHEVVACGDVVDQADDLAGGPDLGSVVSGM
jgi:hypothetical protein